MGLLCIINGFLTVGEISKLEYLATQLVAGFTFGRSDIVTHMASLSTQAGKTS